MGMQLPPDELACEEPPWAELPGEELAGEELEGEEFACAGLSICAKRGFRKIISSAWASQIAAAVTRGDAVEIANPAATFHCAKVSNRIWDLGTPVTPFTG